MAAIARTPEPVKAILSLLILMFVLHVIYDTSAFTAEFMLRLTNDFGWSLYLILL
jgi:hypothetical protein